MLLLCSKAISSAEWDSLIDFDTPRDLRGDRCLIQAHKQYGGFNLRSKLRAKVGTQNKTDEPNGLLGVAVNPCKCLLQQQQTKVE